MASLPHADTPSDWTYPSIMHLSSFRGALHLIRVRKEQAVDAYWLAKSFQHRWQMGHFTALCRRHVNQASVSLERLRGVEVTLPSIAEQHAISQVLRGVQQAKSRAEKVASATIQLKQSLMRHLFTYGPVPVGQADRVTLKETAFGPIPHAWDILPLNECAAVQTGVAKGRKLDLAESIEVPYLRVANVQDGYLDLTEIKQIRIRKSEFDRFALQAGDVVLTEGGDFDKLGRGFIWNGEIPGCVHQNHIFAVRADRGRLLPEYLAYLTQSPYGKAYFLSVAHKTTNLACINTTKLKALPVPVPPIEDQWRIIHSLAAVDAKIEAEEARCQALDTLFRTLLDSLMNGIIRVGDFASA